ncbi:tripartite motif-containing protein 2 [Magallana gigas]|uniref:tripartite motif-containing protein 2 n=1 Tax=Magallana gigas TaxID=29159 RepID=UPI00333EA60F
MDPDDSLQDVKRCDACKTAIVQSYCVICHVSLCKLCIGEHISDDYDNHKVVSFRHRKSTLIYPKCEKHPHKICELQCKDCKKFVCSSCMTSNQHKGHDFEEVLVVFKIKKEIVKNDLEEMEKSISPSYEEGALDLENQLANLSREYEKLTSEISKKGEQWHKEIDIVINKMKTHIIEIKLKHNDILQKYLDEIKKTQPLIKQTLLALKAIENSTEVSTVIEYSSEIGEFSKLPPRINVCLPELIQKPIDREQFYNFFREITPLSTDTKWDVLSQNNFVRKLLDEPELVATIQTGGVNLRSVTCLNEHTIITSGLANNIKCFNVKISLLETMKPKSDKIPNDIAVDRNAYLLYCDGSSGKVYQVKNGQPEEMVILQGWTPIKLCVTSTGDLLVTMFSIDRSKVVRYSGSTEKQTIQFDDEGNPLYSGNSQIKYITENRNHDICVADKAAGAVVVVNQDGKFKWRYIGHPFPTTDEPFKPFGITSDSQSHILTADGDNHCIHILDQNGQFLRYIDNSYCDLKNPYGLCVDNSDMLFVCELYKGTVKKINYLK